MWYCTLSSTVLRYDTVLLEYTTRTVLYLHCLQDLEAQKLYLYSYEYEHGEYCLKYSTVRVQYSTVQYSRVLVQVQAREGSEYRTLRYGTGTVVV